MQAHRLLEDLCELSASKFLVQALRALAHVLPASPTAALVRQTVRAMGQNDRKGSGPERKDGHRASAPFSSALWFPPPPPHQPPPLETRRRGSPNVHRSKRLKKESTSSSSSTDQEKNIARAKRLLSTLSPGHKQLFQDRAEAQKRGNSERESETLAAPLNKSFKAAVDASKVGVAVPSSSPAGVGQLAPGGTLVPPAVLQQLQQTQPQQQALPSTGSNQQLAPCSPQHCLSPFHGHGGLQLSPAFFQLLAKA